MNYAHPEYLMSVQELAGRLDDSGLVVLDVTTTIVPAAGQDFAVEPGEPAFRAAHIPGARYANLETDLSVPAKGLLFTLPDRDSFAYMATRLGIGQNSFVVLYSTGQPGWSARVWLMLRAFGFCNAAVLNGGFNAWKAARLPVETGPSTHNQPATEPFAWTMPDTGIFVGTDDVRGAMAHDAAKLVNALPPEIFRGESPIVYGRPGRIPGSVNLPSASLVGEDGLYLSPEEMEDAFLARGIAAGERVIAYCGAGVAGSNVAFARMLMGEGDASVYDGSLLEWTSDPSRPMEQG